MTKTANKKFGPYRVRTQQDGPTWRCWVGRDVVKPKAEGAGGYEVAEVRMLGDVVDLDHEAQKGRVIERANIIARALNEKAGKRADATVPAFLHDLATFGFGTDEPIDERAVVGFIKERWDDIMEAEW